MAGSQAGPIFRCFASSVMAATSSSAMSSSTQMAGSAMQRSPAQPNAELMTRSAVALIGASFSTSAWFLASVRACTRFPAAAAVV